METVSTLKLKQHADKANMFLDLQSMMVDVERRTFADIRNYYDAVYSLEFLKDYYTEYNVEQKQIYEALKDTNYMLSDGTMFRVHFSYDFPYMSHIAQPRSLDGVPLGWNIQFERDGLMQDSGLGFYATFDEALTVFKTVSE